MTQQEVIKAFMGYLDTTTLKGKAALDAAIKACSTFNSFQELKTAIINDCKNAKSADDFLKTYCGIDLDNDDTGAITGKDAGGATVKTASSIVPEEGSLYEFDKGNWFNNVEGQDGLIVKLAKRTGSLKDSNNVVERDFSELFNDELSNKQEIYLWRSVYKWWIRNGLALISESYGNNFSFDKENSSATNKDRTIYIIFEYFEDSDALADTWGGPSHNQKSTNNLIIRINLEYHDKATGKDGVNEYEHLDRTIAHELTHAVMRANIDYFDYLPALIKEGVAELTHGIDDVRTDAIKKLAADSNLLSQALVLDEETIDVSGIHSPTYAGGYMFLRYLARQAGDLTIENSSDSIVRTFRGNDSISNTRSKTTITSSTSSDTVYNYGASVSIDAGTGNDLISNEHANKVTIVSSTGDDTVWNWSSDDTKMTGVSVSIDAGTGNDTIWNDGNYATINGGTGDDSITSFADNDSINGGADDDYVYNNQGASVTMNGGAGNDSLHNYIGDYLSADAGAGDDYFNNYQGSNVTVNGGAGNDFLQNIQGTNVSLFGGADKDTIVNQGNNVTLRGGTGNDSIYNAGSANVLFKYAAGDGDDTITGFKANSTLQIGNGTGTYSTVKSGNNIVVTAGTGKITLEGAASLTTLNIDGEKYDPTRLTLTNNDNAKITLGAEVLMANASKRTKAIIIVGNALDNTIEGGSANDQFTGGNGDDSIVGNAGNDKIWGQNGNDMLWGGSGNDTLAGGNGTDTLSGGAGADSLNGGAGNDSINGGSGNDIVLGDSGNDKLYGYTGNDTLIGGAGNDSLWGQAGADTFLYTEGDGKDIIYGFDDTDMLQITGAFTTAYSASAKALYFKVGSTAGALVLKSIAATTFNINGDSYQLSNNKLVKK